MERTTDSADEMDRAIYEWQTALRAFTREVSMTVTPSAWKSVSSGESVVPISRFRSKPLAASLIVRMLMSVQHSLMKAFTMYFTAFLLVLATGCAHRQQPAKPMIYKGGQSYDQALHAQD